MNSSPSASAQLQPALRLRSLSAISMAIARARRFDDVLEIVAEEALSTLGAASLSISRWEREHDVLRTLINVGELGPSEVRYPSAEIYALSDYPMVAAVLRDGVTYRTDVDDPHADFVSRQLLLALGKGSDAAVPIMVDGRTWGELWATTRHGDPPLDAADVEFLQAVAGHVATGIVQAEYLQRLEVLAFTDPLTGLANRRALDEALDAAVASDGSAPMPGTALLMCDLDGLKPLNDRFGHAAGDRALVAVGAALREVAATRPSSLPARTGGDEFALLLPDCGLDEAAALAGRLRTLLAAGFPPLSAAIGVASTARGPARPADLLRAADLAQYAAKRKGSGRLRVADGVEAVLPPTVTGGRRRVRDGVADRSGVDSLLVRTVLARLDTSLAGADVGQRLAGVAAEIEAAIGLDWWTVWRFPGGGVGHIAAGGRGRGDTPAPALDDPVVAEALESGVPASRPARAGAGCSLLVPGVAGAADPAWLLELGADRRTTDLDAVATAGRLLVLAALALPGRR